MPRAPKVFISYSHKDRKHLDLLQRILKPMVRDGVIDLWDDTRIASGDKWREEIRKALDDSDIAILLVSDYFLASDFIAKNELPPLLKKVHVHWILVSHCMWDETDLAAYQAAHDVDRSLDGLRLPDRKKILVGVSREIINAWRAEDSRARAAAEARAARRPRRPRIPQSVVQTVLIKSRRRCCLCVFLENDSSKKQGRIAHLNHDPADNSQENLVYLCLPHHDEYDTRSSQSKGLTEQEVTHYRDLLHDENEPPAAERVFNVPLPRSPFFTGRGDILRNLHEAIKGGPTAITGLGGVGKTQIAVEYAHRRRDEYKAVFWVTASDESMLSSGYSDIARCLDLPQKDQNDQQLVIDAVKRWFDSNEGWLLILDNADDPSVLPPFMPGEPKGRILITSRAETLQEVGIPEPLKLEQMPPDEALDFLLKRTGKKDLDDRELQAAESLAKELEYLPLALEQAAAYIVEKRCKFAAYLKGFEQRRLKLLDSQKPLMGNYPKSVVTTWDANFEAVESASRAAADVLRLSAMLAPEPIPHEVLAKGAGKLGPKMSRALAKYPEDPLILDELLSHLSRYSLIRRGEDGWSIHGLVQAVVRERMSEDERRTWAERAVNAVNTASPDPEFANWPLCERFLPHQQACAQQVDLYGVETRAAARMLNQAGYYLHDQGRYAEAEPLCRRALEIREKALGPEHPATALSLNNLAELLRDRGDFDGAEPFYRRALEIREGVLGPEHPDTAQSLNNLATLLYNRADYDGAEPLYRRALQIHDKVFGPKHPNTATSLNNLAALLEKRGDYHGAEPLYRRALEIDEKAYGPDHPDIASDLNNLAALLDKRGDLDAAEPLHRRALDVRERLLGPEHPHTANSLNNLAELLGARGDCAAAEPLLRRALAICEKTVGPEHRLTQKVSGNLERLMRKTKEG